MNLSHIVQLLGSVRIERLPGVVRRQLSARASVSSPLPEPQPHTGGNVLMPEWPPCPPPPTARSDGASDPQ